MDVHPIARLFREELREEGDDLPPLLRDAVGQHLGQNSPIGCLFDGSEIELDLGLGASHLVVVVLHVQPQRLVHGDDLIAYGEEMVVGLSSEVPPLRCDPVDLLSPRRTDHLQTLHSEALLPGCPDTEELIEDVEFQLHSHLCGIGDALCPEYF